MQLTKDQKSIIVKVINCFETGKPQGDYGAIAIFNDGPHNIRQITYGRSQTTEYGNLRELIQRYSQAAGTYSDQLKPYADKVGSVPLTYDKVFIQLLRDAGRKDPVMAKIQDDFFDDRYFKPAMKWSDTNGFTLPLSALVIYDSFIHSGSILWIIRQKFAENPPASGGDEKKWITAYVNARNEWLANHHLEVVRRTTYRTATFIQEINKGNWDLSQVPLNAHGIPVTA